MSRTKTQFGLFINRVRSVSALFSKVNLVKKSRFLHADSEDPDQACRMVRADYNLAWETKAIRLAASCSFPLRFPLTAV